MQMWRMRRTLGSPAYRLSRWQLWLGREEVGLITIVNEWVLICWPVDSGCFLLHIWGLAIAHKHGGCKIHALWTTVIRV